MRVEIVNARKSQIMKNVRKDTSKSILIPNMQDKCALSRPKRFCVRKLRRREITLIPVRMAS